MIDVISWVLALWRSIGSLLDHALGVRMFVFFGIGEWMAVVEDIWILVRRYCRLTEHGVGSTSDPRPV